MQKSSFEFITKYVRELAAIELGTGKEYLVDSRLSKLARDESLGTVDDLALVLMRGAGPELQRKVIEAMTTNETSFFRDLTPFETLRKEILPALIARRAAIKQLNLWCAASSSGQEPFTVAMVMREHFPELTGWKIHFLATDISTEMVERCQRGRFNQIEVNRGLPAPLLVRYFRKLGTEWQIDPALLNMIEFRQMNLIRPWPAMPMLDIVFIRNVLIYFDVATKKGILANIRQRLAPDGYLVLGNSETPVFLDQSFEDAGKTHSGFYRCKAS